MFNKKEKNQLNVYLKKTLFKNDFLLYPFSDTGINNFNTNYIKRKDILLNKFFFVTKNINVLKSVFLLKLNSSIEKELNLSKSFLLKSNNVLFFNLKYFFSGIKLKYFISFFFKSNLLNYFYYLKTI